MHRSDVQVWDLPLRLFHWSLVVLIGFSWWSAEQRWLDWHRISGYAVATLLLFRMIWGFCGGTTARFAHFLRGPVRVAAYCRSELRAQTAWPHPGHNPLGGWSAVIMLSVLAVQTLIGLFAVDVDGIESGPLAYTISFETGRLAAQLHEWVFNGLLLLIGLHITAIAFYRWYKRENLLSAMVNGRRQFEGASAPKKLQFPPLWRGVAVFAVCAAAIYGLVAWIGR